ncbi:MAG: hypothetical protein Q9191_000874 [Dirinaria sp. TL-2023a]
MAAQLITCLGIAFLAALIWTLFTLLRNYVVARRIGLPIVVSPITPLNPFWLICYRVFPSVLHLKRLPFGLGRWARCTYTSWTFDDKCALHDELGDLFSIVSSGSIEVVVADPTAAHDIYTRRKDFVKPSVIYGTTTCSRRILATNSWTDQLNVFGPSLITVEGDDWQRHRRLTAPSFNEKASSVVWAEALRQAHDMLKSWTLRGVHGTFDTVKDTETMTLHVLTHAASGVRYSFDQGVQQLPKGHSMSYKESLSVCLHNIIAFNIIPKQCLSSKFLPSRFRQLGQAVHEFQSYMAENLAQERSLGTGKRHGPANLMGALVQASEDTNMGPNGKISKLGLTDKEIFGNIFIYNLAGHETTANAISMSLVLLAAHPHLQEWLADEVQDILNASSTSAIWEYEKIFPQFRRSNPDPNLLEALKLCMGAYETQYETLRLYGSLPYVPKETGSYGQELSSQGQSYCLPPKTFINLNVQALHTKSQHWGSDALMWNPRRWIMPPDNGGLSPQRDRLISPQRGTFVPWADGPRNCPGQKFAQVEFVAAMATFFAKHRVTPVLREGQSLEDAQRMLIGMVEGSNISYITLQMRQPRKVALRWELKP